MIPLAWALISTEALKIRNTAALWLAVVTPVLATILHVIDLFNRSSFPVGNPGDVWRNLLRNGWSFWALFVPILISFEAATLADLEHRGRHWKQLFTLPIPRWSVYATKILFGGLLLAASSFIVVLGFVGNVLIYNAVSGYQLASDIPWLES
jgi:lantibiotic transport system permease protein